MALKTFQNLTLERREEILMACFKEFALNGYTKVSLSGIIKKLGLAKGSFYRYFSSKKQLYAYLIEDASKRRLSKLDTLIGKPGIDFFELIKQNFLDKVMFDKRFPVIGGFLYQIMHEKDNSEVSDIIKGMYTMVIEQTKYIIQLDVFKDQLCVQDAELVAFQIFQTQLWLYDYVAFKYKINYNENIKNGLPVMNLPEQELEAIIDRAVKMLKNGIKAF